MVEPFVQSSAMSNLVITNVMVALAYFSISISLLLGLRKLHFPFRAIWITIAFFIALRGSSHLIDIYDMRGAHPRLNLAMQLITAAVAVALAIFLIPFRSRVVELGQSIQIAKKQSTLFEKKVEELRLSEERFRLTETFLDSMLENIPIMVFVKDATHLKFVQFNRAGEKLLGYDRKDLLGKGDVDFFPKEQADFFIEKDRAVLLGNEIVDIPEEEIETKSGIRILHTRKIPIFDRYGKPEYLLGISEDITDWKRTQEEKLKIFGEKMALEEREKGARQTSFLADATTILASSFDYTSSLKTLASMFVLNTASWCTITLLNPDGTMERVAAKHSDYKKIALLNELISSVPLHLDSKSAIAEVIRTGHSHYRALVQESDLEVESISSRHLELLKELGLVSIVIVPIKIKDTVHGAIALMSSSADKFYNAQDVAIAEEVGIRAGTAIENAKLYEAVQRAVRSRDEFLSIASHELKTPLTALKLQLEFARRQTKPEQNIAPPPEKVAKMLDTSSQQVNRLAVLVDDLLDVSRIEAGKLNFIFDRVDIISMTNDVLDRYRDQIAVAGCTLKTNFPETSLYATVDRFRIEQVVLNILSNATKYGARGLIELSIVEKDDKIEIRCQDHGMGIPAGKTDKIFERFERAVEATHISGLGLGLYIAREIMNAHGGDIRAESKLNEGSLFIVEIPRAKDVAA
jgi:PAS domain S-box-containing protein